MKTLTNIILVQFFAVAAVLGQDFSLESPDGDIKVGIEVTDRIYYKVELKGENLMWYSPISMTLSGGTVLGKDPRVLKSIPRSIDKTIQSVWGIRSQIRDQYNELRLDLEGGFSLIFRAYDDGVAYRFVTSRKGTLTVISEQVEYRFDQDFKMLAHVVPEFQTSFEQLYTGQTIRQTDPEKYISLPLLIDQGQATIAITESDLYEYPGMYIVRRGNNNRNHLQGTFPGYPSRWEVGGWSQFNLRVTQREDYIARTEGNRSFPWRVMIIAEDDKELADNDLVYKLARPSKIDTDWIKPGKVAWDWWNDWNLEGVDFKTGINNQTYEYYIDFAANNGLEYIILDEGWSDQFDLLLQRPGIDVPYLVNYAREKNVGVILWCVWYVLDRQMQEALDQFEDWGVAGIKVDFIDRDDQIAVNYYERLAMEAAKRKLLVDYHGCSKPTGLHRTYPNVINYEGVRGNEYNKFSQNQTPDHNVDIVYSRMLAGPMDYTPGALRNSTQGNFLTDNSNPMSYGTRCHQLGMYIVYYSPLQMLCDAPTEYEKYPDILSFLSKVPVTWDETVVLEGKVGDYVVIARRQGNDWFLGALTNWDERELEIDLGFLGEGSYQAQMFLDGMNANRKATDYQRITQDVSSAGTIKLPLKQGGGAAIAFFKQ